MKAGTIITCPKNECGAEQLITTVDVPPGGRLSEAGFESLGFDLKNSLTTRCYKCGAHWYRKHPKSGRKQIHTKLDHWVALGERPKNEAKIILPPSKIIQ